MFEPQNETDPMIAANRIGISASSSMSPPVSRNSTRLISATAPPPTPLNSATICGIAVIFTLRAAGMPTAVPIAMPTTISGQSPMRSSSSVAITAIAMPPRRDLVAAHRRPRPAQHVQADDEHRERDDVERGDQITHLRSGFSLTLAPGFALLLNMPSIRSVTRKPPTTLIVPNAIAITSSRSLRNPVGRPDQQDAAEHDDAVDRVGGGHQRRVQRVRHVRDHLEADERGQDEDRELGQEVHQRSTLLSVTGHAGALDHLVLEVELQRARPRRSSARAATGRCARTAATRAGPSATAG